MHQRVAVQRFLHPRRGDHGADRHAATGQAFADQHDVGHHAFALTGPPVAGSAQARLDFVEDQHGVVIVTEFAHPAQVARRRDQHASFGLDRLENHAGTAIEAGQLLFQGLGVTKGQEMGVAQQAGERLAVGRAAGHGQGPEGLAVVAADG
ncbi:hypothetical protein D3C77_606560 [compost metagenome]